MELFDQRLSPLTQGHTQVGGDDGRLVAEPIEAEQPRPEQLATGVDGPKDDENLPLVNRRVLEVRIDEAAGERAEICRALGESSTLRFARISSGRPPDAQVKLQRPTLCVKEVTKGLNGPGLLLRGQAIEVE
jgi:hypothetical protein